MTIFVIKTRWFTVNKLLIKRLSLTYSNGNYWLFLNGHQQLSSIDEVLYHEPLVHPPMQLHENPKHILVLGGGDGAAVREILKYAIDQVTLVDLDPSMTKLAQVHPVLLGINEDALNHPKVRIINQDGFTYLEKTENQYDVIIADFPDPRTVDLGRLYTQEFYWLCRQALKKNGLYNHTGRKSILCSTGFRMYQYHHRKQQVSKRYPFIIKYLPWENGVG